MYRPNERKIEIKLNLDENLQHLPKLSDPRYQYSQLHKRQGFIRYYAAGVAIQSTESFRRQLNRESDAPVFNSPLVLSLSVDSKLSPNNTFLFKNYRRVYIPFGVEVQSIKLNDLMYNNFPQDTDFSLIKIDQCTIDLELRQAKITGSVGVDFNLDETEYDKFQYFQNKIEPLSSHISKVMVRQDIDLYNSDLIANEVFKTVTTMLKSFDLIHSHNYQANRLVREKLINILIDSDKPTLLPNGDIVLSERDESDPVKKPSFATGLFEYKGAFFKDRQEFETSIKFAEIMGQTEDDIIASKKLDNRYEYMMVYLNEDQRIHEITEAEINDPQWVTFAMAEDERNSYESLRTDESTHGKAARLAIARAAKLRWKVANGRI